MKYLLTIDGRLSGINEYTSACRSNPYKGASMKRHDAAVVEIAIYKCNLNGLHITKPVKLNYTFYEKDRRRDLDNVSGWAHKVIQDVLVELGVLSDDGWDEITGYTDSFAVDKENPRIELEIEVADDV